MAAKRRRYPATTSPARRKRAANKRKRRMDGADNDLTSEQWKVIQELWGGCAYCHSAGASMQKDCVQPLSRGGRYTVDNVVPACRSCNASKSNDEVTGWMRRKKLDEQAFLVRLHHIGAELRDRYAEPAPGSELSEPEQVILEQ